MTLVGAVARLLLGLLFATFGLNGFLHFIPAPPIPGPAGEFFSLLFTTHYAYLIFGTQLLAGALLLVNRFVPLALFVLAAVLANILTFHITMQPAGLPMALIATLLWFLAAWPLRETFAPLFTVKTDRK